jgi:drug/metabolite transporter (DMT)-like permease
LFRLPHTFISHHRRVPLRVVSKKIQPQVRHAAVVAHRVRVAGRRTTPPLRAIAGLAIGFSGVVLLVIRDTNGAIAREPFTITIAISSLVIAIGVALVIAPSAPRVEPAPERFNSAAGSFQRRLSRA